MTEAPEQFRLAHPESTTTRDLSYLALGLSIAGLFVIPLLGSIAGLAVGEHVRRGAQQRDDRDVAKVAVIVGWIGLAFWALVILGVVVLVLALTWRALAAAQPKKTSAVS